MKTSPPTEDEIRILLVDHELSKQETIRQMLEDEGLRTLTASNRREALEILRQKPVGLVIINMLMPRAEGIGVIIAIGGFAPEMKIIAMSDAHEAGTVDFLPLAKSLGASALPGDPLDPGKLLDAVHSALDSALHQVAC